MEDEEVKNTIGSETIILLHALWKTKNLFQCPMKDDKSHIFHEWMIMTNYEYILGLNNRGICNGFMKLSE